MKSGINSTPLNEGRKKQIDSLYALKAICAFFVVSIHIPCCYKQFFFEVLQIAVPCFYMITGYFLYAGDKETEREKARRWLRKTIIISAFFNFIYFLAYLITGRLTWNASSLLRLFVFGDSVSVHLWYLTALWQALAIFMMARKYEKAFYFSLILFLWGPIVYFVSVKVGIATIPDCIYLNCLGRALPYLCVGYLISRNKTRIVLGSLYFLIGAMVVFILMKMMDFKFLMLQSVLSIFVFLAALKYDRGVPKIFTWVGKYHSANIYYVHMLVAPFVYFITPNKLKFMLDGGAAICAFVLSFIVSVCMHAILKLREKYPHK